MSTNNKTINKVSEDIKKNRIEKIKNILPEVFEEGKIDLEKLKLALGEEIDERPERFNFTWAGKNKAIKTVLIQSKATLKPAKEESVKFEEYENLIIEGDNLEVLKLLQKTYFEKVKMIYIDPPYNTGGDFVYHDDFSAPINSYLKQTGQLDKEGNKQSTNKETNGRYHSDWLSMMFPRLKLAWNLLKEDGVIFISIDDNEVHNLRKLMDEIFGEENFIANIVVQTNPRGRTLDRYLAKTFEYILVYSKYIEKKCIYQVAKDEKSLLEYRKSDSDGQYRELELRNRNPVFNRKNRPNLYFPLYINPLTTGVSLSKSDEFNETALPLNSKNEDGCWTWSSKKVSQNINKLVGKKVSTGAWRIYRKDYIPEDGATTKEKTLWLDKNLNHENGKEEVGRIFGNTPFDFPKSVELIKKCVRVATKNDGIVLDFFAGSGTTAQAVLELNNEDGGNRKFILVQLPEQTSPESQAFKAGYKTIVEITKERIRRVIKGYGENPKPIDSGFKVFKLAPSNYPEINYEFDPEKTEEENQKSLHEYLAKAKQISLIDKSINPIDIVYENIVKEGFSLNSKVTEGKIDGNNIFIVEDGENEMRICLDKKISPETVKKLSDLEFKSKTFVCYDNALSDSDKANIGLNLELKTI